MLRQCPGMKKARARRGRFELLNAIEFGYEKAGQIIF